MVEKIKDKAWDVIQGSLKNLIITVVEVAKSVAPEVPKEAVIVESSVDTVGVGVLPKVHLSVRVDMSKL